MDEYLDEFFDPTLRLQHRVPLEQFWIVSTSCSQCGTCAHTTTSVYGYDEILCHVVLDPAPIRVAVLLGGWVVI